MTLLKDEDRLDKHLRLRDVFAVSTGAMFSSGFFLLPGLAAAESGPSVVLAYLAAGLLVLPAMFSKAELSTAMPRAGGTYYFLDRSLGPLVGTVGGLGIWLALVLKSAFALIGIGAYLGIVMDVSIRPVAIALTVVFAAFNIVGVKETTRLQQALVYVLLGVLGFFIVQGLTEIAELGVGRVLEGQFRPLFPFGFEGFASTVGLVFVSYAGLTKVASVAEEVDDPDRNIPRGMLLSLITATVVYVVGVFIMVGVLDPVELRSDLTPVATAAQSFFDWLPHPVGLVLVLAAAFAAFASTGNAGILSASRYPLAMARDGLVSPVFAKVGRYGTPGWSVLLTAGTTMAVLLLLDVKSVAKLASAFQLLIFAMINVSVIVMRESRLPSYVPGYRSPLYPWMQVAGVLIPLWLVFELGALSVLFTLGMIGGGIGWYASYARRRVSREGAVYHVFERLGRRRYEGLEPELRQILKEKALGGSAPFEEAVAGAITVELPDEVDTFEGAARTAAERLSEVVPTPPERLLSGFLEETRLGIAPVSRGAALPHLRLDGASESHLLLARARRGIAMGDGAGARRPDGKAEPRGDGLVHALFFLVSPRAAAGAHLHILSRIASHVERPDFLDSWLAAGSSDELKEVLLHEERFLTLRVARGEPTATLRDRPVSELGLPRGVLLVLIERDGAAIVPRADTVVRGGDRLTLLGEAELIRELRSRFSS